MQADIGGRMAIRLAPGHYDQVYYFIADSVGNAVPLDSELLVQAERWSAAKMRCRS